MKHLEGDFRKRKQRINPTCPDLFLLVEKQTNTYAFVCMYGVGASSWVVLLLAWVSKGVARGLLPGWHVG